MDRFINFIERGWIPDPLIRIGIRQLLRKRLSEEKINFNKKNNINSFADNLCSRPIAVDTSKANDQHYELPPSFFNLVLGNYNKYSSCYWGDGAVSLDEAEESSLRITCERAELSDDLDVLELGCGWGSLSLWMAEKYPNSRITSISNSNQQREFINRAAKFKNLNNLEVLTCDMNSFYPKTTFDRVLSVEMFEHMQNYEKLMENISFWLKPKGKLFVHIFCNQKFAYFFSTEGSDNWMGRFFFTGGLMPSEDLLLKFQKNLSLIKQWRWNGRHYMKTSNAWLNNLDREKINILPILEQVYGRKHMNTWFQRWRIFFMSCAELFAYNSGNQWFIAHYLFKKTS
jgi:cyclopropane-fatty-acyl-phospholipid synthase